MKTSILFCLPVLLLLFVACDKDEVVDKGAEPSITNINLSMNSIVGQTQEIMVTIDKGTPCHFIKEVKTNITGKTYSYDFILSNEGTEACIQVVVQETVTVDFEPAESGEYTINFYINGELHQTRTVNVTN